MRLEVGRIGRAHGLNGEVSVAPITNQPNRFDAGATLYIDDRALVIASARPHQDRWLVRFEGINDRTAAETLRGRVLSGDSMGDAPEGELWVHELIGATMVDRAGTELGAIVAVEANPAHDLLVLDGGGLVPIVFVVSHDPERVVVDIPEGLL